MNALPRWELSVLCPTGSIPPTAVGSSARIRLVDEAEGVTRNVALVITSVLHDEDGVDGAHFTLTLGPAEALLSLRSGYRVFLEKTTKEIVAEVLKDAGIPANQIVWRVSGTYLKRLHCVQYAETEWAFIERILADEGISYWFDIEGEEKPVLVLTDSPNAHDTISGAVTLPFSDIGGSARARRFFELEVTESMVTTAVHVREYDVRAPDVRIEGKAGKGWLEHYEAPACVLTSDAAGARAKARLEQLQRFKTEAHGASDCVRVQPGRLLRIEGCNDPSLDAEYLVVRVEHQIAFGAQNDADPEAYHNRLTLVPHAGVAFRPDLPRDVPRITGVEPAITSGPPGEEIHVDDLGRVKVRFHWDRSGITDDKASCWVRCLQMGMGGSMLLPRVGWEVSVAYIDGNPDKPFVLGRVYNATAVVPYGLPGASATSTLQSATSPGGGTTNELRMGDGAGKQEMFLHSTKDQTVTVGGSSTSTVSVNEIHDVGLSLIADIKASQSLTVGASQSVNVGTDYAISLSGSRSEMVSGMESIKVTANRMVMVGGAYSELIGGLYGIQCNQANVSVKGGFMNLIGGTMGLAGGLGVSETVVAARTELVGGGKSLLSAGGASDKVTGIKSITAGPTSEMAGGNVVTATKVAGTIQVGGSATMKAGGPIVIEAPVITLTASSLTAKGLKLSGGSVHVSEGQSEFKGKVTRPSGADLGG